MSRLICRGELVEDHWRWVDVDEALAPTAGERLILRWRSGAPSSRRLTPPTPACG